MGPTKKLIVVLIALFAVIALTIILRTSGILVSNKFKSGKFKIETVERGNVISSIKTTGVVESENKVIVLCPATSIIQRILKEPGDYVKEDDLILQLNTEGVEASILRMKDQLEVRRNNLEKTQLNAQSAKIDQNYNEEAKKARITSLQTQLENQEKLLNAGGITPDRVEQTRQQVSLAKDDLKMLVEKNSIRVKQLEADENGLMLQIKIDSQTLDDYIKLLSKMDVKAPSSGIILDINGHIGQKINADATLVEMSDLSSFKVIGSIDENLSTQIKTGIPVSVILNDGKLQGQIGLIVPAENNKIQFNVHLDQSSDPRLIDNQNVLIDITTNEKDNVLRIKKRPEFTTDKNVQEIYVVEGNEAVEKEIVLGIIGDEYCEVLSGLNEGDVILSENFTSVNRLIKNKVK